MLWTSPNYNPSVSATSRLVTPLFSNASSFSKLFQLFLVDGLPNHRHLQQRSHSFWTLQTPGRVEAGFVWQKTGFCERRNETTGSVKCREFSDWLRNYQLAENDSLRGIVKYLRSTYEQKRVYVFMWCVRNCCPVLTNSGLAENLKYPK
jgi:hypothetical protein